jgi:2,3-bisphosphoglycerate-dependent phosphoglycerate mutase
MMTNYHFRSKVWILMVVLLVQISCKNQNTSKSPIEYDGAMLTKIESNIVYLGDGKSIQLKEDSIQKIYYLVRHAEKDTANKVDPMLTDAGFARATKISDIMRGTRVDAIYSTMTMRALYTVDSLADIKAMSVLPYDNKALRPTLDSIKTSTDFNRIFMVGHSNTIPSIVNSLSGRQVFTKTFDENEYNNFIIVVTKKSGTSDVYCLKY